MGDKVNIENYKEIQKLMFGVLTHHQECVSCVTNLSLPPSLFKSDGQETLTIEWQELKNRFPSFFVHK